MSQMGIGSNCRSLPFAGRTAAIILLADDFVIDRLKKEGQPVPESNFELESKSSASQQMHRNLPAAFGKSSL